MQTASQAYKQEMKQTLRNHSYIKVTIGMVNQDAQAEAVVPDKEDYTYYSNLKWPLDNYEVTELYAVCDQNYTTVDKSMYFLPREAADVVLNQGIVTDSILGTVEIRFPIPYDMKGLTIEFGKAYPVDFVIESNNNTVAFTANADGHFVTEEIFDGTTCLRIIPSKMVNGQSRLRIHKITMGIGIYFDNRTILSATKKEYISPIMEELPSLDISLVVDNKNRTFDIENETSSVNYLEIGQEISVLYGQELEDGNVEWLPGGTAYLREWSADDEEMSFSATDRFEDLDGIYYRGIYSREGISLYDLAIDVLTDAQADVRTYWIDPYLKTINVYNPVPAVTYKEALQLIANAGRCVMYQNRNGKICIKSSFIPDMVAGSDNETYFSHAGAILNESDREDYAMPACDYSQGTAVQYFLPRQSSGNTYLNTGYISEGAAGEDGTFEENPTVEILLEAAYKCFGLTLEFGRNHPETVVFHSYWNGDLQEDYMADKLEEVAVIQHEFPEFDRLVIEFTKGCPHNRVVLDHVSFGDSTDYDLSYGKELTRTPKGTQLAKVRELQVVRTLYHLSNEEPKELARETILAETGDQYTFHFSNPSYGLTAAITEALEGQNVRILESSAYRATVQFTGVSGEIEVTISGKEYVVTQTKVSRQMNPTGTLETWENPLVSEPEHANDLTDWVGNYLRADREYNLTYRGEPRIDSNDLAFLENKYVPDMLVRVYEHTLKFNGALSGTIKARRDMSNVEAAKNRLAGK